jgi:predicted aldo/keto reductase-like oxidoreductase
MQLPEMKRLGFGCMRLPVIDRQDQVDVESVIKMVDYSLANGFTYFDTAHPYHGGHSETALREALVKRHPRDSFFLADKMPPWEIKAPSDYERVFEEQLERCGVTFFDFYLLHNMGIANYDLMLKTGGFDYLRGLKRDGKATYIGFSFHDMPELLDRILTEQPEVDFVQLQINYADWERPSIQSRACLEVANKHGKPVIVMEPVKGGGLANPADAIKALFEAKNPEMSPASWAIRFAASQPGVKLVLSGMTALSQMEDNICYMADFKPMTAEELDTVQQAMTIINESTAIPCTNCQYCVDTCPQKINIPALFSVYNMVEQFGKQNFPAMHYQRATTGRGKASACIACGQCESHCPQHIAIIETLVKVAERFEKKRA